MENKFELTGKLINKSDVQVINDKFSKQTFVIEFEEVNNDYKQVQTVSFEAISKKMHEALAGVELQSEVKVRFSVTGRPWNDKFFNSLKAWNIEVVQGVATSTHTNDSAHAEPTVTNDLPWDL